jgi:membrane complex biogenesis BtpA family protein
MSWLEDAFGVSKPIIAMCHLGALPGDPDFNHEKGVDYLIERARKDLIALQDGGVDAVMFSNEASLPYLIKVEPITSIVMSRIIGELHNEIRIPFGVNVLWDAIASIDVAVATGAIFVREIFTGVYASDFGLWNTNCGEVVRYRNRINGSHIKLLFNILPEAASYLGNRSITDLARSTIFNNHPDALCVSGLTAGVETSTTVLAQVRKVAGDTPIFANTGVRMDNVEKQLSIADGAVTGTTFKRDGYIWNEVDPERVREFMAKVRSFRDK